MVIENVMRSNIVSSVVRCDECTSPSLIPLYFSGLRDHLVWFESADNIWKDVSASQPDVQLPCAALNMGRDSALLGGYSRHC